MGQTKETRPHSTAMLSTLSAANAIPDYPGAFPRPIDPALLELYHLFLKEEGLAKEIADDSRTFTKDQIYQIELLAREIARSGYSLQLVGTDEVLDIAQTFTFESPFLASLAQELLLEDPRAPKETTPFANPEEFLTYATELTTSPDSRTASSILVQLLASLKEVGNSAWTARVAATLAYFSALKN